MKLYILKKVFSLFSSLVIIVTVTFFCMHSIPGDPFLEEQPIPDEIIHTLKQYYKLDRPIFEQYQEFITRLLHGDLGPSFKYQGRSVSDIIIDGLPISLLIGVEACIIALSGGLFFGIYCAYRNKTFFEKLPKSFFLIVMSAPTFVIATLLQYIFALKLHLLPVARCESFLHTLLPALSLSSVPLAYIFRLTISVASTLLSSEMVEGLRIRGISEWRILSRHVLRNSLVPVLAYTGPFCAHLLTGSFVIEKIYGIPGLGYYFVSSVVNRDYTVLVGVTFCYSVLTLIFVLLTDLLLPLIDPRISFSEKRSMHG